ncbi:hypothetical protein [Arcobacter sp. LA11]|uniref:hypothetical protein n=1 Tax=Arcobacter sp. LA11 TaxID=1898176 RepID=UPI0009341554|nr:hypothetical protein [Arcobacter sp. LA11]
MIKVCFLATNSGSHGSPNTIMEKEYESSKDILHLPKVGDEIILQYGEIREQSSTFKVEKIQKEFLIDYDDITIYVKNIE